MLKSSLSASNTPQIRRKKGTARLMELAFRHKALSGFACFFSALSAILSFIPFLMIYFIVRELLLNYGSIDTALITRYGWIACGGAMASLLIYTLALTCSHLSAFNTLYELKLEFTNHLASLPLGFHTDNSTGKLRKIIDENIEKLESFIAHQLPDIVGSITTPIVSIVVLFLFDWRLGLPVLIGIISCFAVQMIAMSGKKQQEFMKKYQDSLDEMSNSAVEYVRGIEVVKAFGQSVFSFRKFHKSIKDYSDFVYQYTKSFSTGMGFFMTIVMHLHIFVMPTAILLIKPEINIAEFSLSVIFYLIFSMSLSGPFMKIMYISSGMVQISDGISRMDIILDELPLPETVVTKNIPNYNVSFSNIYFSYKDTNENALMDINFTANQGAFTALVGASGSGKTTIAHLIPRFYDVNSGSINIGGVNIKDIPADQIMNMVSFVFQDVFLFKQSVFENLRIGKPSATDEEVIEAAKAAECHDFIMALPKGYDTEIETKGIHLSGGERQRLVIARAILKDAPIVVLDEATAFADPENEDKIQKAFVRLMKNKTVIVIAHRLSTIKNANKIIVLDKGRVVEQGTHNELISNNTYYTNMWNHYTKATNWTIQNKEEKKYVAKSI